MGGRGGGHGRRLTRPVCQRPQALGRLLGTTPPSRGVKLTQVNDAHPQCFFNKSRRNSLVNLHKGDVVTITGKCDGRVLTNVVLKDCELNP